jgi:hypothetical protein
LVQGKEVEVPAVHSSSLASDLGPASEAASVGSFGATSGDSFGAGSEDSFGAAFEDSSGAAFEGHLG